MRGIAAACVVACWIGPVMAQSGTPSKEQIEAEVRKKEALDHAFALGERFGQFSDPVTSASSLALLGQAVCRYNRAYAETLYTNALSTLAGAQNVQSSVLAHTRAQVIARAAACDAGLARKLNTGAADDASVSAGSALQSARAVLAENPQAAADFAREATTGPLDPPDLAAFLDFLNQLRQAGETEAANDLFLTRTAWMSQQSAFDAGYTALVAYISGAQQPDAGVVVPWLEGAANMAGRAGPNDTAAETLLVSSALTLARLSAPEMVPRFAALDQQLGGSEGDASPASPPAADDEQAQIDKDANPVVQDDVRVRLIEQHWSTKGVRGMRDLAAGISDSTLKAKMDALVTFAEAATIPGVSAHVRPSTKSCLLWLSRHSPSRTATEARAADVRLRPLLLLGAAREAESWNDLVQAIFAFNEADDPARPKDLPARPGDAPRETMSGWDEVIQTQVATHHFPLRSMASVSCLQLKCGVAPFAAADPDRTEAVIEKMRNERRQAEALTYVAAARLAKAFASSPEGH